MPREMPILIMLAGGVLLAVGLILYLGPFDWLGRLPGDIRIERGGTRIYLPFATMLVVSIVLSIVLSIVRRFF